MKLRIAFAGFRVGGFGFGILGWGLGMLVFEERDVRAQWLLLEVLGSGCS